MPVIPNQINHPKKITSKNRWIVATGLTLLFGTAAVADIGLIAEGSSTVSPPEIVTSVMGMRTLAPKNQQTTAPATKWTKKTLPDTTVPAAAEPLPNDPYANDQWSFMAPEQFPGAANMFNTPHHNGNQTQIIVAIVDSGMLLDHEDYRTLPGYDFVHDPAIGNDGDGRDSDPTDPGDWVNQADIMLDQVADNCQITDSKWHGTAIAGLIGALSENQLGVAGGTSFASLLPVRVTGKCGGYVNDLIDGIRWAAGLTVAGAPTNPTPARIINLSVGFPGKCSSRLQSTIDDATNAGAILVTAATNNAVSLDTHPYSPATCKNVLSIGAALRNGLLADYSAYGTDVFLLGPGGTAADGIVSTDNTGSQQADQQSGYGYHYGTSLAAAHVSAALATLLSIDPTLSNKTLESLLSNSASVNANDPQCKDGSCGSGRLNTNRAVSMLLDPSVQNNDLAGSNFSQDNLPVTAAAQPSEQSALGSMGLGFLWLITVLFIKRYGQRSI